MTTRAVLLFSLLLSFAAVVCTDAFDVRVYFNEPERQQTSTVGNLDKFLALIRPGTFTRHRPGKRPAAPATGKFHARLASLIVFHGDTNGASSSYPRKLYRLQEVLRI